MDVRIVKRKDEKSAQRKVTDDFILIYWPIWLPFCLTESLSLCIWLSFFLSLSLYFYFFCLSLSPSYSLSLSLSLSLIIFLPHFLSFHSPFPAFPVAPLSPFLSFPHPSLTFLISLPLCVPLSPISYLYSLLADRLDWFIHWP